MFTFYYKGPVMEFGVCAVGKWEASTRAVSESKARSNLAYQYKKKYGLYPNTPITLPGRILQVSSENRKGD